MDIRRATYGAAIKLAMVFSAAAALVALALDAIGDVSTTNFVIAVAVVGFTTSWIQTGRVTRSVELHSHHRVSMTALRQPIG